jgi:hypothetical protein
MKAICSLSLTHADGLAAYSVEGDRAPIPRELFTRRHLPPRGGGRRYVVFGLLYLSCCTSTVASGAPSAPPPPPLSFRAPQLRPPPSPQARPGGRLCRTTGLACGPSIPNSFPLTPGNSRTTIHRSRHSVPAIGRTKKKRKQSNQVVLEMVESGAGESAVIAGDFVRHPSIMGVDAVSRGL